VLVLTLRINFRHTKPLQCSRQNYCYTTTFIPHAPSAYALFASLARTSPQLPPPAGFRSRVRCPSTKENGEPVVPPLAAGLTLRTACFTFINIHSLRALTRSIKWCWIAFICSLCFQHSHLALLWASIRYCSSNILVQYDIILLNAYRVVIRLGGRANSLHLFSCKSIYTIPHIEEQI